MQIQLTKTTKILAFIAAFGAAMAVVNEYRFWATASEAGYLADLTCPRARLEVTGQIDRVELQIELAQKAKNYQRVLDKKKDLRIWQEEKSQIIRKCKHFKK